MDSAMITRIIDLLKDFLRLIGLGEMVEKGEAEFDKIMSNVRPIE